VPAVGFDLDSALIDSHHQHLNAGSEALRAAGTVIPRRKVRRRVGMSGRSMMQELLREIAGRKGKIDLDQLERKYDSRFRPVIPHGEPRPGTNQLLRHFYRRGLRFKSKLRAQVVENRLRCD
jgi:beta-phosphoglucomutase-like phosphatase (HAD superfamily)